MKVLIAVDGSKYSDAAVESVCKRQWPADTEFMVLGVAEHLIIGLDPMLEQYESEAWEDVKRQCEDFVTKSASMLKQEFKTAPVLAVVIEGNAADQIVQQAKAWGADFVVMGSHGRSGLEKFLLGSVTESVVSRSPCSVEVIKMTAVKHSLPVKVSTASTSS